jgi:threonine aldolase
VIFDVSGTGSSSAEISRALKDRGVLINGINDRQMRAVTHYDVTRKDCEQAAGVLADVLAGKAAQTV